MRNWSKIEKLYRENTVTKELAEDEMAANEHAADNLSVFVTLSEIEKRFPDLFNWSLLATVTELDYILNLYCTFAWQISSSLS